MMRKSKITILTATVLVMLFVSCAHPRTAKVTFREESHASRINIFVGDRYFTTLLYSDTLEKPLLFPILTPSGKTITRGYPIDPRPYERTDHPHQVGLWFNFGDVNGLDFWNNSTAIAPEKKEGYGHIRLDSVLQVDPEAGELITLSSWRDHHEKRLLSEITTYRFSGDAEQNRFIERISHLTALQQVTLRSNKEGLFAIRVDRAFEEESEKPSNRLDASSLPANEPFAYNEGVNGHYRNREGMSGEEEVWGKRTPWVALTAEKEGEIITLVMLDHPLNPGHPGWPHARGYGLFSMNNLGGDAVEPGSEPVQIMLEPGEEITFHHMLIIGGEMTDETINEMMTQFHYQ